MAENETLTLLRAINGKLDTVLERQEEHHEILSALVDAATATNATVREILEAARGGDHDGPSPMETALVTVAQNLHNLTARLDTLPASVADRVLEGVHEQADQP